MHRFVKIPASTLAALSLALPFSGVAHAQSPVGTIVTFVMPAGEFGSDQFTDLVVNTLGAARKFCGALEKSYQVDCLAERIGNMARNIPANSDYAEVRQVLNETSRDMSRLARANRASGQNAQSVTIGGQTTTRPLTPVAEANRAAVNQQAAAILQRTETLLLRTPDDDSGKKLHYTRIAEAIGSNKTLLRSA